MIGLDGRPLSALASVALPWPPTVNLYWQTGTTRRGRQFTHRSTEAQEYERKAVVAIRTQRTPQMRLTGSLWVWIEASPPDRRVRDLDNILKPILDVITRAGIIEDDRYIDSLMIRRDAAAPQGRVLVRVGLQGG